MTQSFSMDLCQRLFEYVEQGHSRRSAARHFSVSVSFAIDLLRHLKKAGSLEPLPCGGTKEGKLAPHHDAILRWVKEKPDITLAVLSTSVLIEVTRHWLLFSFWSLTSGGNTLM